MLVSRRRVGDWVRVVHGPSGDVLDFRVFEIGPGGPLRAGDLNFVFDDEARRFEIGRQDRRRAPVAMADKAGDRP